MHRREIQRRLLASEAYWNRSSNQTCHDTSVEPRPQREIRPGEEGYTVSVNRETGAIAVVGFINGGQETQNDVDSLRAPYPFGDEPYTTPEAAAGVMEHGFVPGAKTVKESNAVLEQRAILDSSSYWGIDYGSLRNGEP